MTTNSMSTETRYLDRGEGRVAYDLQPADRAAAPLVVCLPGMGELRTSYRELPLALMEAGYRVARLDLRGHGDSDTTFSSYDDEALASDVLALIGELGGPAVLVGSSMAAGAAVIAASRQPEAVSGLVLAGPFVRDGGNAVLRLLMRVALWRPWGRAVWRGYYRKLFPQQVPSWFEEHRADQRASLASTANWNAFQRTARTTHAPAEAALDTFTTTPPTLVVMGSADPDWKDPKAEGEWLAGKLHGELEMVDGVGHYPLVEAADRTVPLVIGRLRGWFG